MTTPSAHKRLENNTPNLNRSSVGDIALEGIKGFGEGIEQGFLRMANGMSMNNLKKWSDNIFDGAYTRQEQNFENLSFDDYISILKDNPTEEAKKTEFYDEHKSLNLEELMALEQDKMLYFFLAYNSQLVLANAGDKKDFLGYEFSERRGKEGINIYKDNNNNIISSLFSDIDIFDTNKLNSYIYKNFINEDIKQSIVNINLAEEHPLKNHIDYCRLSELINFSLPKFEKVINLNSKKKTKF